MQKTIIGGLSLLVLRVIVSYFNRKQIRQMLIPRIKPELILKKPLQQNDKTVNVLFLHHSTGLNVWTGGVEQWFSKHQSQSQYSISEQHFPVNFGNDPFDYWNIWVKHAGPKPFINEPTLEMIAKEYNVVIFKHCFPVSVIEPGNVKPSVGSNQKTLDNYKLQYAALFTKLLEFPKTKFILWTGASLVKGSTTPENAQRAKEFFEWVKNDWDKPGDNIFLWDFQSLETEGGLYLLDKFAVGPDDSHPNKVFSREVAPLFCQRIVDVIEGRGDRGDRTGRQSVVTIQ